MIPKKIHYCWFGRNPKPELAEKCIASWKKFCPDYEIVEWNEDNYDISRNRYMKEAYDAKKWGFVPDYARLDIICRHGGIYLDTDVELIKPLDDLLKNEAFAGIEVEDKTAYVAFGLGFGAESGNAVIKSIRDTYDSLRFINGDGSLNLTASPILNSAALEKMGFCRENRLQTVGGLRLYPSDYFSPISFETRKLRITENTHSIHWYAASWQGDDEKEYRQRLSRLSKIIGRRGADVLLGICSSIKREGFADYVRNRAAKYLRKI